MRWPRFARRPAAVGSLLPAQRTVSPAPPARAVTTVLELADVLPMVQRLRVARAVRETVNGEAASVRAQWAAILSAPATADEIADICLYLAARACQGLRCAHDGVNRFDVSVEFPFADDRQAGDPDEAVDGSPAGQGVLAAVRVLAAHHNGCDDIARAVVHAVVTADPSRSSATQTAFFECLTRLAAIRQPLHHGQQVTP